MNESKLDKTGLFSDYISRYEYKNIDKAYEDFEKIFKILEVISYAIQINKFNDYSTLDEEVVAFFRILCEREVIDSFPFEYYDRYSSIHPRLKGE